MNTAKAKQLDFPRLLEKMGYYPVQGGIKKSGREIWYRSPLNQNEVTPSFHITKGKRVAWVFKCFSTGAGGTIIDFVMAHEGYASNDIPSVLSFLRDHFPGSLFDRNGGEKSEADISHSLMVKDMTDHAPKPLAADRQLIYLEDLPLKSGRLLSYLQEQRKISTKLSQKYLRLVRYKNLKSDKSYYAFGMKNRAGGFEVRAASDTYSFKSALIARDISIVEGATSSNEVLVFEGMLDFLSYLEVQGVMQPHCDAVILHSVNSYNRFKDFCKERNYQHLHLFLDNDPTGEKYTQRFQDDFGPKVSSHSGAFQPHKDLNEALQAGMQVRFFQKQTATDHSPHLV